MAKSRTQQPSDIEELISKLLSEAHPLPSRATLMEGILRASESGETTREASGESLNINYAILSKLAERLAEFNLAMSVRIELNSLAKDIERPESPEKAVIALVELLVAMIRHIRILSRAKTASGQRLKTSDQLAAGNASAYIQLPTAPVVIRLIVLIPSKNESAGIECLLSQRPLSSKPQYEALSYTWGDPAESRAITVNGKPFRVTKNLYIALHHLRDRVTPRVIWIDAICINQNDVPEKTHQVQLMRDIYKYASRVIVWLGQESETSAKAINFIHRLPYWITGSDRPLVFSLIPAPKLEYTERRMKNVLQLPEYQKGWMAIQEFLRRPWWKRIWVSQELAMASKATFMCGNLVIHMQTFEQFCIFFMQYAKLFPRFATIFSTASSSLFDDALAFAVPMSVVMQNRAIVQRSLSKGTPVELPHLLLSSMVLESTDPRDRLYALLGMTFNSKYGDELLIPDYSLSTPEVYIKFAAHILSTRQTLDLLSHISHTGVQLLNRDRDDDVRVSGLPSWVPDWSSARRIAVLDNGSLRNNQESNFRASLDRKSPIPFKFSDDGNSLVVRGFVVDEIQSIGDTPGSDSSLLDKWRTMISQADDEPFLGKQTVREAFLRTVFCDQWMHTSAVRLGDNIKSVMKFPPTKGEQEKRLIRLAASGASRWLHHRRFFVSVRGHIGLAPSLARPGDTVAVLFGGQVPYTLRKRSSDSNLYSFLGECYVHGAMDGEIIHASLRGEYEVEEFELY